MKRVLRYTLWTFAVLLATVLVGIAGGYFWLRTSLPQHEGTAALPGLAQPVEVLRDADGIVTIKAGSDLDAYRALGYLHAQDRLWQMDLMRRSGAGRLSEVIGSPTIRMDRFMRTLGIYRLAEASYARLSPEVQAAVEAYSAGVNHFIETHEGAWPPEFYLLRYRPEPWKPADSVVWGRLMALQLSGNWRDELRRVRVSKVLSAAQAQALWPDYPARAPVAINDLDKGASLKPFGDPFNDLPWALQPKDASNSWALSGDRTESGRPILANDPHLALNAPGLWYLVHIQTPDRSIRGVTAPGVPFVILGQNDHLAWGFTTTHSDTQDLFIERRDPDKSGHYVTANGSLPFQERDEVIAVRGDEDVVLTIRTTRNGPIVSDLFGGESALDDDGTELSLAWPALWDDDLTAEATHGLGHAHNWEEFLEASRKFHSPQQNIIYADREGRIALIAPARVPIRAKGDGRLPVPAWMDEYRWTGLVPFDGLPLGSNPSSGLLVAANNKIVPDGYPYLITADWPAHYRAERIEDFFANRERSGVEDSLLLQNDSLSLAARQLLPRLLDTEASSPETERALGLLAQWDGVMDRRRPEPLIYQVWVDKLNQDLLADELGAEFEAFARPQPRLLANALSDPEGVWCNDVATATQETCSEVLTGSLQKALSVLSEEFGADMAAWRWGEVHRATFPHPVFRHIPGLRSIFDFGLETDGGNHTVNRAGMRFQGDLKERYVGIHGAGYRAVYDLADPDNSRFMISTGQSANPLSPLYGSLAERWRDGHYVKMVGDTTESQRRLLLNPE